jgi:hypothetical protein
MYLRDSPDSLTFAKQFTKDSPDSPTFAEPFTEYLPDSPTFAKPLTEYSPDSPTFAKGHFQKKRDWPRHIRTSNSPFWRIWGEWPLLSFTPTFVISSTLTINAFFRSNYHKVSSCDFRNFFVCRIYENKKIKICLMCAVDKLM